MTKVVVAALRVYVFGFGLIFAAVGISVIMDPGLGMSEPPYPTRADVLPEATLKILVALACMASATGCRMRRGYRATALVLVIGGIFYGYGILTSVIERSPLTAAATLAIIGCLTILGPVSGALWLWSRAHRTPSEGIQA